MLLCFAEYDPPPSINTRCNCFLSIPLVERICHVPFSHSKGPSQRVVAQKLCRQLLRLSGQKVGEKAYLRFKARVANRLNHISRWVETHSMAVYKKLQPISQFSKVWCTLYVYRITIKTGLNYLTDTTHIRMYIMLIKKK